MHAATAIVRKPITANYSRRAGRIAWRTLERAGFPTLQVASVQKPRFDVRGRPFKAAEELRIIPEGGGFRLDCAPSYDGAFFPWEPVSLEIFKTVAAAQKAAAAYIAA